MRRSLAFHGIVLALLAAFGCARPKVWEPPRIDLHRYGTLGLVEFDAAGAHGPETTRRFLVTLHAAQAGVPVLELGPVRQLLQQVGHATLGPEAVRAIGAKHGVDALVLGDLQVDDPRPRFSVQSFTQANASATIEGTLSTRILDARSGATLWSDEARGERSVASLDMSAGVTPQIAAADPHSETAKLVGWLVERVTSDFRGRWVKR